MQHSIPPENRAFLVHCVADGLRRPSNGAPTDSTDLLALLVAERVVAHLDQLGFIVLKRRTERDHRP